MPHMFGIIFLSKVIVAHGPNAPILNLIKFYVCF